MVKLTMIMFVMVSVPVFAGIDNGLVLHYEFEGNANDSSGHSFNGTEIGGLTYVQGVSGYAGSFDGVDDYIDISTSLGGYSAFSQFAWVKINALQSSSSFIQTSNWYVDDTHGNDGGFDLAVAAGSYVKSWINQPDRTADSEIANSHVDLNQWYFVGVTWDGSTHRMYLNGTEVASSTYTGYMGTSDKNSLVAAKHYGDGLTGFLNGNIDELRIYNRALNTQEIEQLYTIPEPATLLLLCLGAVVLRQNHKY
ncbi:MAG: hypothetical protein A2Y12_09840 [Planctomycetes bacterium GWF2_42_9]|nr:MAG: hypothetical protein A2Y12_09840 [Planctomycetes bacterium GWF2_42_9]